MAITYQEANEILSKGYPEPDLLKRFPYGNLLYRLWSRDDEDGKEYRAHGPKVLDAMNILLGNDPNRLFGSRVDDESAGLLRTTQFEMSNHFVRFDSSTKALFRLAAVYHDIGKYIIKERHPIVGWYTMEYLEPSQKEALRTLVGNREDYLQLLLIMIRDHDQFGVLCTGEASYPILLSAATSLGSSFEDQRRTISAIMWLNLADMAGTPGLDLNYEDLTKIIADWKWYLDALQICADKKQRLDDFVIQEASKEELVEQRICRLLIESSRKIPRRLEELRVQNMNEKMVATLVRNQLRTVYPTQIPRREFASQFTHICKMDYGLRFFARLAEYCEGVPASGEIRSLPSWAERRLETDRFIYAVLAILRRTTSTYLAMIRPDRGIGNLIGVELKDLTPRNAPEKTAQICKLLIESHYPGLSWLMSDCPAWFF